MAVLVRSCCCCGCSLRIGVLVIAVLTLIGAGLEIYFSFSSASELYRGRYEDLPPSAEHSQVLINSQKADGAFGIFQVLTSLSLIAACILKNRFLAKPYLPLQVIFVGYCLFVIIYFSVVLGVVAAIFVLIRYGIVFSLSIYFLIMVYSFHEALREDPSGVTAGFVPNYPSGSAPMATTV